MIRKARVHDIKQIQDLIGEYAKQDLMLPRSLNELYENTRDFFVYTDKKGKISGCCALHISWDDLAEVKSLAVKSFFQKKGIGKKLVQAAIKEAKTLEVNKVFTLTYVPEFFRKIGFKKIAKSRLPHKIWSECVRCVKFPDCDEIPMMLKIHR